MTTQVLPQRCPDCVGLPRDLVTERGHFVVADGVGHLEPHTGCPDPSCRHGGWSHQEGVGCVAGWYPGGEECPCLLGPDWEPIRFGEGGR